MLQIYLHAALLICSSMLLISVFTYASLILVSFFLTIISLVLFTCGCELFAVILFFCEIHVMFMLVCLSLSWLKFDSMLSNTMYSEQRYTLSVVMLLPMILIVCVFFGDASSNTQALYIIPSFESISYYNLNSILYGNAVLTQTIAGALFIVSSFEFLLINIFMTLAVFMYLAILKYTSNSRFSSSAKNMCTSLRANIFGGYILRSQNQLYQYTKLPIACIFVHMDQLTRWWRDDRIFKKIIKN